MFIDYYYYDEINKKSAEVCRIEFLSIDAKGETEGKKSIYVKDWMSIFITVNAALNQTVEPKIAPWKKIMMPIWSLLAPNPQITINRYINSTHFLVETIVLRL